MSRLIALCALVLLSSAATAGGTGHFEAFGADPQSAGVNDMRIMAPYVGTFRSVDHTFDDSDIAYHFEVDYQWFDAGQTIVKWTVTMVIPEQQRRIVNGQGFYGYDAFEQRLYVFGAFSRGVSGWGAIGSFDHDSGAREVWARSRDAEGVDTFVRDRFEVLDGDRWRNETWLRTGDESEWRKVYEGVYTRVEA